MNFKFLLSLLCAGALTASAQGYKDGIEYYKADQYANARRSSSEHSTTDRPTRQHRITIWVR